MKAENEKQREPHKPVTFFEREWQRILEEIKRNITEKAYDTWFLPIEIVFIDIDDHVVYLETGNPYATDILQKRYMRLMEESCSKVLNDDYKIVLRTEFMRDEKPSAALIKQRRRVRK